MTGIQDEENTKAKDIEFGDGDIWCETPKSKINLKYDIPEKLWGNWSIEEEANTTCGCKERNFWNHPVRVLGSVKGPNETIVAVLDCGG
jgi:hypothetical protein